MSDHGETLFFVHVMKTAGTSFLFYMRQNIPPAQIFPGDGDPIEARLELARLRAVPAERRARTIAYTGHFPAFAGKTVGATKTVTLLRDPVERVISMLKQRQRPAYPPTGRWLPRTPHLSLAEIYRDPDTRPWVDNVQARIFAMTAEDQPATFLDPIELDATRLEMAKERLAGIDVVGLQEDFGAMTRAAAEAFGWAPLAAEPRAFVADEVPVPDDLREQIAEDQRWDRELYAFARRLVAERAQPERRQ